MESPIQRPPHCQQGFGLIEVLVALTILSVGMLGLAAMQLKSLQASRESLNTTIATIMVRDMNERAWAQQDQGEASCKEHLEELVSDWKDYVTKNASMPDVVPKREDLTKESSTSVNGRYYALTIEWGSEDDNHVELVSFLPCKSSQSSEMEEPEPEDD